jgi:hypothetical protein
VRRYIFIYDKKSEEENANLYFLLGEYTVSRDIYKKLGMEYSELIFYCDVMAGESASRILENFRNPHHDNEYIHLRRIYFIVLYLVEHELVQSNFPFYYDCVNSFEGREFPLSKAIFSVELTRTLVEYTTYCRKVMFHLFISSNIFYGNELYELAYDCLEDTLRYIRKCKLEEERVLSYVHLLYTLTCDRLGIPNPEVFQSLLSGDNRLFKEAMGVFDNFRLGPDFTFEIYRGVRNLREKISYEKCIRINIHEKLIIRPSCNQVVLVVVHGSKEYVYRADGGEFIIDFRDSDEYTIKGFKKVINGVTIVKDVNLRVIIAEKRFLYLEAGSIHTIYSRQNYELPCKVECNFDGLLALSIDGITHILEVRCGTNEIRVSLAFHKDGTHKVDIELSPLGDPVIETNGLGIKETPSDLRIRRTLVFKVKRSLTVRAYSSKYYSRLIYVEIKN